MTHIPQTTSLSHCPRDVFRDSLAYSVVAKAGGKRVNRPRTQLSGQLRDGEGVARVLEYEADGVVVARLVEACGHVETWLRSDLATETLVRRADAFAERERIIKELTNYLRASPQHARDQRADEYVLSSSLIHAAARRNAKLGRLYDLDSRGDKIRGNLVAALDRAVKAEGGAK
jgi:hypothetical protein